MRDTLSPELNLLGRTDAYTAYASGSSITNGLREEMSCRVDGNARIGKASVRTSRELQARDRKLKDLDEKLAKSAVTPDREVLRAAVRLRGTQWRDVLRGPHLDQARVVLTPLFSILEVYTDVPQAELFTVSIGRKP